MQLKFSDLTTKKPYEATCRSCGWRKRIEEPTEVESCPNCDSRRILVKKVTGRPKRTVRDAEKKGRSPWG